MMRPLGDRVVVFPVKEEDEVSKSGIVYADFKTGNLPKGTVVAVGTGYYSHGVKIFPDVSVGDIVAYYKSSATDISEDDVDYLLFREKDLLVVLSAD